MRIAALVLAAGKGERFGGDKLAATLTGRRLLDRVIDIALASPAERVIVVARPGLAVPGDPRVVSIELASAALSESLRAGLAAAGRADGVLIFLGDMPLVPLDMAARLTAALGDAPAALPIWRGRPGHPVLLAKSAFPLADAISGDEGLGRILRDVDGVVRLPVDEGGVVLDVDRAEDLAALEPFAAP